MKPEEQYTGKYDLMTSEQIRRSRAPKVDVPPDEIDDDHDDDHEQWHEDEAGQERKQGEQLPRQDAEQAAESANITIFARTLLDAGQGREGLRVSVRRDCSVGDLKEAIIRKAEELAVQLPFDLASSSTRGLQYQGRILEDGDVLSAFPIPDQGTVNISL